MALTQFLLMDSYYHGILAATVPGVTGLVIIRLYRLGILFSPGKLVTREVGDYKTPEAGVLFSPGQKTLHQVGW